jgi:GntR family transcriptional regulator
VNIKLSPEDGAPIYRQIISQVKYLVASRLLAPGEELPSIRVLARTLRVTPTTILHAYGALEAAGIVHKRRGSGTFVSKARLHLTHAERRRLLEPRITSLLAEAHQLNFTPQDVLRMVTEHRAEMDRDRD